MPKRYGAWWIEYLFASICGYGKYRSGLGKIVRPGKPSSQSRSPEASELTLGIPPPREVHFAMTANDDSQFQ
jgi:hypothetical protein